MLAARSATRSTKQRLWLPAGYRGRSPAYTWAAPAAVWSTTERSCRSSPNAASAPVWWGRCLSRSRSSLGGAGAGGGPRRKNQMITVCFIENVDAMGVHTGDSYCTAPMLHHLPELQQQLQRYSYSIVEAIEVIGGTNIQFAHDHNTGRVVVIRDQPAHLALVRPRLQSHRLP